MILANRGNLPGYEFLGDTNLIGLDEEEERRKELRMLAEQRAAEDARNIQVRQAVQGPPPRETRPGLDRQGMDRLQNLLLRVRAGEIAEPTQVQKQQINDLLLGTPEENAARQADYAETERIKQLVAGAGANKGTGASFNINPITGQPQFWRTVPKGYEEVYTPKQDQDIAKYSNALQGVIDSDSMDQRDKDVAVRKLMTRINSIRNNPVLKKKEPPPPMGDSWESTFVHPETGDIMGYDRNRMPRVLAPYKSTPEYLEKIRNDDREAKLLDAHSRRMEKEADLQARREERIANRRLELAEDDTAVQDGVNAKGEPKFRARNSTEIDDIIRRSGLLDISSEVERSITRVATPEQLQYGPSGIPSGVSLPQQPVPDLQWREEQSRKGIPQVRGNKERDALPPGAIYIGPDGKRRMKK